MTRRDSPAAGTARRGVGALRCTATAGRWFSATALAGSG